MRDDPKTIINVLRVTSKSVLAYRLMRGLIRLRPAFRLTPFDWFAVRLLSTVNVSTIIAEGCDCIEKVEPGKLDLVSNLNPVKVLVPSTG